MALSPAERRHLSDRRYRFGSDDIYRRLRAKLDEFETERRQRARREVDSARGEIAGASPSLKQPQR
jgi:hypothetical protein